MKGILWGGMILSLLAACAPAPLPRPPVDTRTPEPKFWRDFPVMPGGLEIPDEIGDYHYTVVTGVPKVVDFYLTSMKETDWELVGMSKERQGTMESATLWFADRESTVSLQIWSTTVITDVAFMEDSRYPTPSH